MLKTNINGACLADHNPPRKFLNNFLFFNKIQCRFYRLFPKLHSSNSSITLLEQPQETKTHQVGPLYCPYYALLFSMYLLLVMSSEINKTR